MNSKAEWNQPLVPRVVVTQELEELDEHAGTRQGGQRGSTGGRGRGGGPDDRGAEAEPKISF